MAVLYRMDRAGARHVRGGMDPVRYRLCTTLMALGWVGQWRRGSTMAGPRAGGGDHRGGPSLRPDNIGGKNA